MGDSEHGGITRNYEDGSYTYSVKDDMGNKPVNYVSFWDAARFCNWLTTGDTEFGVYNLGDITNPTNNTIVRNLQYWNEGVGGVAIASENEWYKAAYYSGSSDYGADDDGYCSHKTQSQHWKQVCV